MLSHWILALRPKTLPASISPILLGSALAYSEASFNVLVFIVALLCAVFLQIAVNLANDLFDAQSGVDGVQRLGPVRVAQSGLISHSKLRIALYSTVSIAALLGLLLCGLSSWWLLLFGLASLLGVFLYSGGPYPLASHGLGEVTVLIFFGWLAVMGSYFVQTHALSGLAMGYGSVAGLMSAAIMLVNNIRDIPTDAPAGKRTLAVRLGEQRSRWLYKAALLTALMLHFLLSWPLGWWALLPALLIAPLLRHLLLTINERTGRQLNKQLAQTAQLLLLYCFTQSAVWWGLTHFTSALTLPVN